MEVYQREQEGRAGGVGGTGSSDIQSMVEREGAATRHILEEIDRTVTTQTSTFYRGGTFERSEGDHQRSDDDRNGNPGGHSRHGSTKYRTEAELMLSRSGGGRGGGGPAGPGMNDSCSSLSGMSSGRSSPGYLSSSGVEHTHSGIDRIRGARNESIESWEQQQQILRMNQQCGDPRQQTGGSQGQQRDEFDRDPQDTLRREQRELLDREQLMKHRMEEQRIHELQLEREEQLRLQRQQQHLEPEMNARQKQLLLLQQQLHQREEDEENYPRNEDSRQQSREDPYKQQQQPRNHNPLGTKPGGPSSGGVTSAQLAERMASLLPPDRSVSGMSVGSGAESGADDMSRISSATLTAIREQITASLQRMRELEEQNKAIPVLQVCRAVACRAVACSYRYEQL